jgi:hypothetical protein
MLARFRLACTVSDGHFFQMLLMFFEEKRTSPTTKIGSLLLIRRAESV